MINRYGINTLLKAAVISILTLVIGCSDKGGYVSNLPMLANLDYDNKRIWLVTDYNSKPITHYTVEFENSRVKTKSNQVYVNQHSQFVMKDGTPITDFEGNYLYWNEQGYVINKHIKVIDKARLFRLSKSKVSNNTPFLINFHNPIKVS
jgi:hypothetical protein